MEELSEFLGWAAIALFSLVVALGLLLRFGKLKKARSAVSVAHRIGTLVAVVALAGHFLAVEARPLLLVVLGLALVALPVLTMVLKRLKKLVWAVNLKIAAVPLLAAGLFLAHLGVGESENSGPRSGHVEEHEDD